MNLFRRVVRLILFLFGLVVAVVSAAALFFARQMIRPGRQPLWATPADAGLPYEDVEFPARDGLRLSGWFVRGEQASEGQERKPAIILLHGWTWNRLGDTADTLMGNLSGASQVDLLRLLHALQGAGYHVLAFDLRNHGRSASGGPVTFGLQESNDVLGAVDYLKSRDDVDGDRLGVVGFSVGANALLFALPHTDEIGAAVAVQPVSPALFAERYAVDLLGPLGRPALALTEFIYQQAGHLPLSAIEPLMTAPGAGNVPVLYIQGKGDPWGSVGNVAQMAAKTPGAVDPLFVDSHHRYGGYRYPVEHPEVVIEFFEQKLRQTGREAPAR